MIWAYQTNGTSFTSVSISGDGGIISGTHERSVLVFNRSGKLLQTFNSSSSVVRSAVSRNGETIVSSGDGELTMFDLKGNLLGKKVQPGAIWDVAISDDGRYGAASVDLGWQTRKGKIVVIDRNGSSVLDYPTLSQGVGVGISSDGSSIVGIDDYNLYSVFPNGTLRWSFPSSPPFRDVAITPDGKYIVAGSQYYLRVFNETGSLLWQNQEAGYVYSVAISENGDYIIAGSSDKVRLFDKSGNLLWHYDQGVSHVAASKNGNYFAVGTNKEIMYFNKWGNSTVIDEPNLPVKSGYPNSSSSVAMPSTPKPAPLSYMGVIGALFCISVVASFSKKTKNK
ncbi:MAG: PQQ-binding-like beta-propeller repeat protein [Methanomicrobiales archaeon]|nr:PQQ-binding-like beta-propeller repeat protein [Methanomicrobiales archaeon]